MDFPTSLQLALTILGTLPQRPGIDWYTAPADDGVLIRCVIYPGQSTAHVTSLDQANAEVDGLITRAEAMAVATSMTEQGPFDEPMIDDRRLDDAGEEVEP